MKKIAAPKGIPVLVLYVNSIIERKLVKTLKDPGWSVTGVDNLNAELSGKRIELIQELIPSLKTVLILYYQRIAPSRIGVEIATQTAAKKGIVVDARVVSSREDMIAVMSSLIPGEVDAMLTVPTAPIDNALTDIILPNTRRLNIPLFTYSRPMVEKGALAAYGAHFYELGKQASRQALKILSGIKPEKMPFETPKQFRYTLDKKQLNGFGITLSSVAKTQINDLIIESSFK
jgi:putative ABC transport system substrate-binding protein